MNFTCIFNPWTKYTFHIGRIWKMEVENYNLCTQEETLICKRELNDAKANKTRIPEKYVT